MKHGVVAGAYWHLIADVIEPFVYGGDAAFYHITSMTC